MYYIFYKRYLIKVKDIIYLKLLLLALFGIFMSYMPLFRHIRYYVLLAIPPGIILSVYFFEKLFSYQRDVTSKKTLRILSIIIIIYLSIHYLSNIRGFINILSSLNKCQAWSVSLDRGIISLPAYKNDEINQTFPFKNKEKFLDIINYIKKNTPKDSKIFVASHDAMFYFLMDRDNATKFDHIIRIYLTPEDKASQKDIIEDLIKNKARYVIFSNVMMYWGGNITYKQYIEKLIPEVYDFIINNYKLEKKIGCFELWATHRMASPIRKTTSSADLHPELQGPV